MSFTDRPLPASPGLGDVPNDYDVPNYVNAIVLRIQRRRRIRKSVAALFLHLSRMCSFTSRRG